MGKRAIIIGAGPAGLTAALELLRRTDVKPIVLEATQEIGGILAPSATRATGWTSAATGSFPRATA